MGVKPTMGTKGPRGKLWPGSGGRLLPEQEGFTPLLLQLKQFTEQVM